MKIKVKTKKVIWKTEDIEVQQYKLINPSNELSHLFCDAHKGAIGFKRPIAIVTLSPLNLGKIRVCHDCLVKSGIIAEGE